MNSSNRPCKAEFEGIAKKLHVKRNFAELAPNIGFSEFDFYDLYRSTFEKSELGWMKKLLPLHAMAENFGLVSKSTSS